jgi:hypothetical protein
MEFLLRMLWSSVNERKGSVKALRIIPIASMIWGLFWIRPELILSEDGEDNVRENA